MPSTDSIPPSTLDDVCALAHTISPNHRVVCGEGSPTARLVIVGEAPGRDEALQGRPFVGAAGRLLTEMLAEAGLKRDEVWITNTVKHRPIVRSAGGERNRPPTAAEIQAYLPILVRELQIIHSRLVLCLGNVPASTLIRKDFKMTRDHGLFFPGPSGSRAMGTYHPAYLLRLQGQAREEVLDEVRADLRAVVAALADP